MNSAYELFVDELRHMLNCENKLIHALGELERESKRPEVQQAYREHLKQTEGHAKRLIDIMRDLGETPEQSDCKTIDGLVEEKKSFMKKDPSQEVLEFFNIGAGIKSERYEISAYEGMIKLAQELGAMNSAKLLKEILSEEEQALHILSGFVDQCLPLNLGITGKSPEGQLTPKAA